MMKKTISMIIGLMFLVSVVAQPPMPLLVSGEVRGSATQQIGGLLIRQTNLNTEDSLFFTTTGGGHFLIDWSVAPSHNRVGDDIRVTIVDCEQESFCNQDVQLSSDPIHVIFDISQACLPCPECPECVWTEEKCKFEYPCPETTTTTTTICPVPTEEECKELYPCGEGMCLTLFQVVLTIIITLTAGGGIGLTVSKNIKTGKLFIRITQHKHPTHPSASARRMHSIYTVHSINPHPKGEINPKYNENGKYIGD